MDISKCSGGAQLNPFGKTFICPIKDKCYRYTVPSKEYNQSWFIMPPKTGGKDCDMYIENKPEVTKDES